MSSYCGQAGYQTKQIEKLEELLVDKKKGKLILKNKSLFSNVNDMHIKLGFLLLSKDALTRIEHNHPNAQPYVAYYVSNFIYDCKAFLDSVAVTLNSVYELGFEGGYIDLCKDNFVTSLEIKEPDLVNKTKKQTAWINKVVDWRNKLIHRFSIVVNPFMEKPGPPDENDDPDSFPIMMLVTPLPIHELMTDPSKIMEKHGKTMQDIMPFCDDWIAESKTLFENTCDSIIIKLKKNNSN